MNLLVSPLVAAFLVDLVLAAVLTFLWRRERAPHALWWAAAVLVGGLRYLVVAAERLLALPEAWNPAEPVLDVLMLGASLLLLAGALSLRHRRLPLPWLVAGALAVLWAAGAGLLGAHLLWRAPLYAYSAACLLWTGVALLRVAPPRFGARVAGIATVLWGLHRLDYPLLRPIPPAAFWGYLLAEFLSLAVGIGLVTLAFELVWERAQEGERRWRSLFEGAIEGVFRADAQGRFLAVNPALVRMLGYASADALLALDPARDLVVSPEDWTRLFADESARVRDDLVLRRSDGARIVVSLRARVQGGAGEPRRLDGFVRDVTEARELQQRLARKEKLEALGRVSGSVAHDFNNLLTVMLASEETALDALPEGSLARENVLEGHHATLKAVELTRELLTFARRRPTVRRVFDLGELVSQLEGMLRRLAGTNVRLHVDVAAEPLRISADPVQLERVLVNLVVNAAEAMPDGGRLDVRVGRARPGAGEAACLEVSDQGGGMSEETLAHAFEPFFTTKGAHGTGLGLATVYGIVAQSGGRIDLSSRIGEGTTVRVALPLEAAEGGARGVAVHET